MAKPEPEGLEISWEDPPPPTIVRQKAWRWEILLRPVKAAPGTNPRIRIHETRAAANSEVRRIKARLAKVAPLEDWKFEVHELESKTHYKFGVWACYLGDMSRQEYNRRRMEFQMRSERIKKAHRRRQVAEAQLHELIQPGFGRN